MRRRSPKGGCHCNGRYFRGGCFLPATGEIIPMITPVPPKAVRIDSTATVDALSSLLIHKTEGEMDPDPRYEKALDRTLWRRAKPSDGRVLDRHRRAAVASLADHIDPLVRRHFAGMLANYPNL